MECYNLHCWGEEDTSYMGRITGCSPSPPLGEGGTPSDSSFIYQATQNEHPRSQSNSPAHCIAQTTAVVQAGAGKRFFCKKPLRKQFRFCKPLCHNYSPLFLEHESSHRRPVSECICLPPKETVFTKTAAHIWPLGYHLLIPGLGKRLQKFESGRWQEMKYF